MKKKNFSKMLATAVIAAASVSVGFAQTNIGAECGCPTFSTRPVVDLSTLLDGNKEFSATNTVLDCGHTYLLKEKSYVASGKSITIAPGTVILGRDLNAPGAGAASALIIERGGKIFASGTATCPIVFTTEVDPMDGTYPLSNRGKWGGLVILGKAKNNIPAVGSLATGTAGVGFVEGYGAADSKILFGMPAGQEDDNDNSGILRYVSVRHAGDIISAGNELNGITLGSVGAGTQIDHVEIVSCDDDAIELFGGTVNVKYVSCLFGNDDMLDFDDSWRGKAQFIFGIHSTSLAPDADNGFECDGDDNKSNITPMSHPYIYNATLIGANKTTATSDNSGMAAIKAKERTEGEIYNSLFINWRNGLDLIQAMGTRTGGVESYHNWNAGSLIVSCNTFNAISQNPLSIANAATALIAADNTKFTTDNNSNVPSAIAGIDYAFAFGAANSVTNTFGAVPSSAIATTCTAPVDGFFSPANYRGAFQPGKKSWLSDWSYLNVIQATQGLVPCPTDINQDGSTNNVDFLQLLGQFNQTCN